MIQEQHDRLYQVSYFQYLDDSNVLHLVKFLAFDLRNCFFFEKVYDLMMCNCLLFIRYFDYFGLGFDLCLVQVTTTFWIDSIWYLMAKNFFHFMLFDSFQVDYLLNDYLISLILRTLAGLPNLYRLDSMVVPKEQNLNYQDFIPLNQYAVGVHSSQIIQYAELKILYFQVLLYPSDFIFVSSHSFFVFPPIFLIVDMTTFYSA